MNSFFRIAIAGILIAGLPGCGQEPSVRTDNERPFVVLTVPSGADRLPYTTTFLWTGSDRDGLIDHYEFAIDIPDSIPLESINDPEYTGIAWESTTAGEMRFQFDTPEQDSVIENGTVIVRSVDVGNHCFFVRSVDNEGAPSEADFYCFTAENVHPRTTILVNNPGTGSTISVCGRTRQFQLIWTGLDPDGSDPGMKPAYYEWKQIPINVLPLPFVDLSHAVNVSPGPNYPWIRTDVETVLVNLQTPQGYILAVRAIDENGGTENQFIRWRNAVVLQSYTSDGVPTLTVSERTLGSHVFPNDGPVAQYVVPRDYSLRFNFAADGSAYGGIIQEYNWGVDVDDIENDDEFHAWNLVPHTEDITFDAPGIHNVVVKVRDTCDGVTYGTILLNVIEIPRDREVLYVDDYRQNRQGPVTNTMMDARARAMLQGAGYADADIFVLDAWGEDDLEVAPRAITLVDLARYRLVVWSVFGSGLGGTNALVSSVVCRQVIQPYLQAGGGLWVYGDQVWGSFRRFGSGTCKATLGYSESTGLNFDPIHFPCEYLTICGGDFREAKTPSASSGVINGLLHALPTDEASDDMFPPMEVDSTVLALQGGIPYVDAMFQPTFSPGGLDSLYIMRAAATNSGFNNKPVAFRYFDPDPGSQQGPIAIFGFSFHLLKQGSAAERTGVQGMARSMVAWFRSHQPVG